MLMHNEIVYRLKRSSLDALNEKGACGSGNAG